MIIDNKYIMADLQPHYWFANLDIINEEQPCFDYEKQYIKFIQKIGKKHGTISGSFLSQLTQGEYNAIKTDVNTHLHSNTTIHTLDNLNPYDVESRVAMEWNDLIYSGTVEIEKDQYNLLHNTNIFITETLVLHNDPSARERIPSILANVPKRNCALFIKKPDKNEIDDLIAKYIERGNNIGFWYAEYTPKDLIDWSNAGILFLDDELASQISYFKMKFYKN